MLLGCVEEKLTDHCSMLSNLSLVLDSSIKLRAKYSVSDSWVDYSIAVNTSFAKETILCYSVQVGPLTKSIAMLQDNKVIFSK